MGGHIDGCDSCGNITIVTTLAATDIVPNVKEQTKKIGSRLETELLPVPIFTGGFTFPIVSIH
jgi:hypothetical protein